MRAALPRKWDDTEVIPPFCLMGAAAPFWRRVSPVVPHGGLTSVSAQASGASAPFARGLRIRKWFGN